MFWKYSVAQCTIYNQIRNNKESILSDNLNSITLQRQTLIEVNERKKLRIAE